VDGQTVYAAPGVQINVRTGKTIAVSNIKEGIPDKTTGHELLPETPINDNHLLIFPKETRCLKADPQTDNQIWIMIGSFTVYDANEKKVTPISE
jgi:hypothetical protein